MALSSSTVQHRGDTLLKFTISFHSHSCSSLILFLMPEWMFMQVLPSLPQDSAFRKAAEGAWGAQAVKRPPSPQVMISGSSPASGFPFSEQSACPSPLAPHPCVCPLSPLFQINKTFSKNRLLDRFLLVPSPGRAMPGLCACWPLGSCSPWPLLVQLGQSPSY